MTVYVTPTEIQVILKNFCAEEAFKNYVKNVVNNELFWKELFQKGQMDDKINNKIDKKISNVKKENNDEIAKKFNEFIVMQLPLHLNNALNNQLPGQLLKQLPTFLGNDCTMQKLLTDHRNNVSNQMDREFTERMNGITNDDKYHEITRSYLDNVTNRGETQIKDQLAENNRKLSNQLQDNAQKFDTTMSEMKYLVNNSLSKVNGVNEAMSNLNGDLGKLKKEVKQLKSNAFMHNVIIGVVGLCSIIGGICYYVK